MPRIVAAGAFALLMVIISAAASAQEPAGADLYIRRGCLGCHGASGRGGVGPTLANTKLTIDAFVNQLRHPRGIMPPFHQQIVTDTEARAIFAYLQGVPPPSPKLRADVPKGELDQKTCAECHRKLNPIIVAQFEASAMGKAGRQNPAVALPTPNMPPQMTCAGCHGTNHDDIMATTCFGTPFFIEQSVGCFAA